MKKTLAAVAILGAFAGSAMADVTVYGLMDLGVNYAKEASGAETVQLKSNDSSSRIGFKGTEKISEDLTVGFKLETQFDADTGANKSTFFHRESLVYIQTAYGELGLGRTGALDATTGSYGFYGSGATVFGGGYGTMSYGGLDYVLLGLNSRLDNSITYKSPKMAGVTLFAQAASAGSDDEFCDEVNRYYGIGAQYQAGAFAARMTVSQTEFAKGTMAEGEVAEDAMAVTGNVSYDFGVAKVALTAQYFDNADVEVDGDEDGWRGDKGYGVALGAAAPVFGGTFSAIVGYGESESVADKTLEFKNMMVGAHYTYPLSKQTYVYTGAGYHALEESAAGVKDMEEGFSASAGIVHKF